MVKLTVRVRVRVNSSCNCSTVVMRRNLTASIGFATFSWILIRAFSNYKIKWFRQQHPPLHLCIPGIGQYALGLSYAGPVNERMYLAD